MRSERELKAAKMLLLDFIKHPAGQELDADAYANLMNYVSVVEWVLGDPSSGARMFHEILLKLCDLLHGPFKDEEEEKETVH